MFSRPNVENKADLKTTLVASGLLLHPYLTAFLQRLLDEPRLVYLRTPPL